MNLLHTEIEGLVVIEPQAFEDPRGFFMEAFHRERYEALGVHADFCQDNLSFSCQKTLRGLHYQLPREQAKLVQVLQGEVFDVAVDVRQDSPTLGQWVGVHLSDTNHRQVYVPAGCAHGFCVLSEVADFLYKCTDWYYPEYEQTILWSDPHLAIEWPIREPLLSNKDQQGVAWDQARLFAKSGSGSVAR